MQLFYKEGKKKTNPNLFYIGCSFSCLNKSFSTAWKGCMCWNVAQGYVLLSIPSWPAGSRLSLPFSLLFEQMGLGNEGKERQSVLINAPSTQTQTWAQGTYRTGLLLLHTHPLRPYVPAHKGRRKTHIEPATRHLPRMSPHQLIKNIYITFSKALLIGNFPFIQLHNLKM